MGLIHTRSHHFVEHTPVERRNTFFQSAVVAQGQRDKNAAASFAANTLKLLGNRSFGYQKMDCSHHSKYCLIDK